jgi:endonuclease G
MRDVSASVGPTKTRSWRRDPALTAERTLGPDDYKGAHAALKVDRGHQAPLASFTGTPYWEETNYLSNITPQKSALNEGPWANLEDAVRALAKRSDVSGVFGMTGPLYERAMPSLPNASKAHRVPSGYWKILAVTEGTTMRVAAFVLDQDTPRSANFCDYRTTVHEVEQRSKLNFFYMLPPAEKATVQSQPGTLATDLGCAPLAKVSEPRAGHASGRT